MEQHSDRTDFETFVIQHELKLRIALTAVFGQETGRDAAAEALAYAWEHWERVSAMMNPAGYLYRVGRTSQRRRKEPVWVPIPAAVIPDVEPGLPAAINSLSERQRLAVVLVHGYNWSRHDVAGLTGLSVSSIDTHLSRGLAKLRTSLGVETHA